MPTNQPRWMSLFWLSWLAWLLSCENAPSVSPQVNKVTLRSLVDLEGKPASLERMPPAKARVVIFTRTDCPISNRMAPEVQRLIQQYQPRVAFYLVYVDPNEEVEDIRKHLQEYQFSCPALRDPKHELASLFHATVTPEAVVLGAGNDHPCYRGRITDLYLALGKPRADVTTHDLEYAIEATLAGKPVPTPWPPAVGCIIADLKK